MMYEAFYKSSSAVQPMSFSQVVSYVWLQQAFLAFFAMWFRDGELFDAITSGNVAYELVRPLNIYLFWYVKLLAQRLSSAALRCLPILFVAFYSLCLTGCSRPLRRNP
jgi:ABC-2 type transport system permease protein